MTQNETPKAPAQDLGTESLDSVVGGALSTDARRKQEQDDKVTEQAGKTA